MSNSYEQMLETALRELEHLVVDQVEREFEALPDNADELPLIGGEPFCYFDRATQKKAAVAALLAKQWFEYEAPKWAQPLPLTAEACYARFNGPHQRDLRARLVGEYGLRLREARWDLQLAPKFEVFCSQILSPSGR